MSEDFWSKNKYEEINCIQFFLSCFYYGTSSSFRFIIFAILKNDLAVGNEHFIIVINIDRLLTTSGETKANKNSHFFFFIYVT